MQNYQIHMNQVTYNAAEQAFQALVTIRGAKSARKYACAIRGPISMTFEDAANGLSKQAARRHESRGGIYSEITQNAPRQRAGRPRFEPLRWIANLMQHPGSKAA